jgi:hypothetical protein
MDGMSEAGAAVVDSERADAGVLVDGQSRDVAENGNGEP